MRTGIKTLFKKIRTGLKYPDTIIGFDNPNSLPALGFSTLKIRLKIFSLKSYLEDISRYPRLNEIHNLPHPAAIKAWNTLLPFNPNNIGNWSIPKKFTLSGTQKIERDLVAMVIKLLGGNIKEWGGYVTGGGTESNLYAMWLGRNKLMKQHPTDQICVCCNDLSHYSILKSSNILNLKTFRSPLDRITWSFDIESLKQTVIRLHQKGYRAFIIPITLGYTQTGTNDDYKKMIIMMDSLKQKLHLDYYAFIDAALSGLVLPFVSNNFQPLRLKTVNTVNVDFHKFGMAPLPCGLVLYRHHLRKNIQLDTNYLSEPDSTLSGSRSGVSPVAAYMVLMSLGKTGFKKIAAKSIQVKNDFVRRVKNRFPAIEIINESNSLTVGLASPTPLPQDFLNHNGLFAKKNTYHFSAGQNTKLFLYKATFIAS